MELNREHIIKALECHQKNEKENTCEYCTNCPASKYDLCEGVVTDYCEDEMFTAAILLINELTDKNERLRAEEKQSQILIKTLHDKLDEGYAKFVDEERADTVRKMAERLKQILREEGRSGHYIKATIDQVAKEFDPHWMDQDGK